MNVRQLERLLVTHGAPQSFLDTVTRVLRSDSRLPIGGRGPHAPQITGDEAAWVMIALAATDTAAQAARGLSRQIDLQIPDGLPAQHARSFVDAVQVILGSEDWAARVHEIRVGRSCPHSQIIYRDGTIEHFVLPEIPAGQAAGVGSSAFRSEGILGGGLVHQVAIDINGDENQLRGLGC